MSTKSDGFVMIKDRIPYYGKGVDDLVSALKRVLSEPANKYTQKIVLEVGTPHIYIEKLVPEGEANVPQLSLHDAIRNVKMEEFEVDPELTPLQQLWEMFSILGKEDLQASNLVAGNKQKFQKWLGVRIPNSSPNILGTPFHVEGELPEDVFVICGAPTKNAEPYDIKYCVKGTIL